jgi:adenylate cyclase
MAEVVRAHGGVLDRFAGDAVMAVVGAPNPVADHPERAVRCAVAMQRRQAELNAEARALGLPASDIGIGLNTGTVIAGLIGGAGRVDYTVIGDAVNVAQRLQSEAKAGEILASAATMGRFRGRRLSRPGPGCPRAASSQSTCPASNGRNEEHRRPPATRRPW